MKKETLISGWKRGWPWGTFMFIVMEVVPVIKKKEFDPLLIGVGLIIWMFGGIFWGVWCNHIMNKREERPHQSSDPM